MLQLEQAGWWEVPWRKHHVQEPLGRNAIAPRLGITAWLGVSYKKTSYLAMTRERATGSAHDQHGSCVCPWDQGDPCGNFQTSQAIAKTTIALYKLTVKPTADDNTSIFHWTWRSQAGGCLRPSLLPTGVHGTGRYTLLATRGKRSTPTQLQTLPSTRVAVWVTCRCHSDANV